MNKRDLINYVSDEVGIYKKDASIVIDVVLRGIKSGICEDGRVTLTDFGSFERIKRQKRLARNPKTNEMVSVPEKETVKFHLSKNLTCKLNK